MNARLLVTGCSGEPPLSPPDDPHAAREAAIDERTDALFADPEALIEAMVRNRPSLYDELVDAVRKYAEWTLDVEALHA